MNALKARKRYDQEQAELRHRAWLKAEEEKLAAMDPEERKKYEADKKKRVNNALSLLGISQMIGGPYSR